jgi:hypothetical protein
MIRSTLLVAVLCAVPCSMTGLLHAAPPRIATRVFFQDDDARLLKWADLQAGDALTLTAPAPIEGFPKLDVKRQSLVQMEAAAGWLLVGVRDEDDGTFQSGWVLIETGVEEEEHGDHSHWNYVRPPRVRAVQLDDQQGNPAHLYCYDDVFYLANDRKNGYTRIDPRAVTSTDDAAAIRRKAQFIPGGGGHITLAVVNKALGFSSWIDRDGPNKGRVDITPIGAGPAQIAASFHLPSGGIHGATALHGKVFLAPSDGICWIDASKWSAADKQPPAVQHVSLGKVDDKPLRTGAFTTFGRYVACVTGAGKQTAVCLADATKSKIELTRVPVALAEGNRAAGLSFVQPRKGSPLGFVFHDHAAGTDAPNRLSLLELDADGNGDWADARVAQELDVGKSRVEGHSGHHAIDFDADRRWAVFTNPGDGTLALFSLAERKTVTVFPVSGVPSKVALVGGRGGSH